MKGNEIKKTFLITGDKPIKMYKIYFHLLLEKQMQCFVILKDLAEKIIKHVCWKVEENMNLCNDWNAYAGKT